MNDLAYQHGDLLSMPDVPDVTTSRRSPDFIEFRICDLEKAFLFDRTRWNRARQTLLEEVTRRGLCVSEWRDEERKDTVFRVQRWPTSCDLSYPRLMLDR